MNLITKMMVEGKELEVSKRRIGNNSRYVVYRNQIWKITGSQGAGINYKLQIEKPSISKMLWLDREKLKDILYVVTNTGYMNV